MNYFPHAKISTGGIFISGLFVIDFLYLYTQKNSAFVILLCDVNNAILFKIKVAHYNLL